MLLSKVGEHLLEVLKQSLGKTFNRLVETRDKIRSLNYAYAPCRKQYVSPRLLSRLRRIKKSSGDKILGILAVDLYLPEFEYLLVY